MAYVPGFENDLFISYSHADDATWLQAFEQALRRSLRERLGLDVSVWQDVKKLRVGQDWQDGIAQAILSAAAFVAVLTPSYRTSDWCARERRQFLGQFTPLSQARVGDLYRFFKVVKVPWEDRAHRQLLAEIQHEEFFRDVEGPEGFVEMPPGSDEFRQKVQRLAAAVTALLRQMRRNGESVFVATPAADVRGPGEELRRELEQQEYAVRPEGVLDEWFSDEQVRAEIDPAVLSVHLLGPAHDRFAERQLRLAAERERRMLVWLSREAARTADPEQQRLFAALRDGDGFASLILLEGQMPRAMIAEVLAALQPRGPEPAPVPPGAPPRVYLLHDPTATEDTAFARELQEEMRRRDRLDVFRPEKGVGAARHQQLLRDCEGVLLYRDAAPLEWFAQNLRDVLCADRMFGRKRQVAKGFLLREPAALEGEPGITVISRETGFQYSDLEPFLGPLRRPGDLHAGA